LKKIIATIKPTKEERESEKNIAKELVKKLKRVVPKGMKVVLTGSIAKDTFLSKSNDIDIFILVPKSFEKKQFETLVKSIVEKAFPSTQYELKYAEHPYARLYVNDRRVDVVPAYKIKAADELGSAVDRSVLHTHFIMKKLKKRQKDDVLLLKKFLMANELYGAELRVEGFSGYLCELLIINYKNFINTIKAISKWKLPVFIDIKKYYRTKDEREVALKRFNAPLVVIDPVDINRNVAAAVSEKNAKKLISLAKKFLKRPSADFFLRRTLTFDEKLEKMKKRKGVVYVISMPKSDVADDIVWGQLKRLATSITKYLEKNEFVVRDCILGDNEKNVSIALLIESDVLSPTKIVRGPPLNMEENVEKFKKMHEKEETFVKNGRLFAIVARESRTINDALKKFFDDAKLPSHLGPLENVEILKYAGDNFIMIKKSKQQRWLECLKKLKN
jgi:tRNA nucleotidyltransferase (CCA-adding enzyme)